MYNLPTDPLAAIDRAIGVLQLATALATATTAWAVLCHAWLVWGDRKMTAKGTKNGKPKDSSGTTVDNGPDFLAGIVSGEFAELPAQLVANIGTIAGLAITGGGYFGISASDDGVTARLVVKRGQLQTDRRYYRVADLEAALAKCLTVLRG